MNLDIKQSEWKSAIRQQFGKDWYLKKNRIAFKFRFNEIKKFIPDKRAILLLDVGTGDGQMLYKLCKERVYDTYAIGIDISFEIVKVARSLIKNSKCHNYIHYINSDSDFLPFRNEKFNFLIGSALIEHVINPFLTIKEIKRVGSKKSRIILTTPNPLYSYLFRLLSILKIKYKENRFSNPQIILKMKKIFEKLNLKVIYCSGFSGISSILDKIVSKISFRGYHLLLNQIIIGEKK